MRFIVYPCVLIALSACVEDGVEAPEHHTDDSGTVPQEPVLFDLSFSGVDYTSHVGETVTFALWDNGTGSMATFSAVVDPAAELVVLQPAVLEPGTSYTLYLYADHDLNGVCDPPPVDHGWTVGIADVTDHTHVVFDHDSVFDDYVCDGF